MKIIDLLNKIANGEEVPFLIKYEDIILKYDLQGQDYRVYQSGYLFKNLFERENCKFLNDEVEIIEEDKKIESIDVEYYKTNDERYNELLEEIASFQEWCIDKVNSLENKQ